MEPNNSQEKNREVLELTSRIGEVLLKNGGEIFRVQETMQRIAKAYGVKRFHVYVLANGIFTSIEEDGTQISRQLAQETGCKGPDDACQVRHVPLSSIHLGRVAAVNNLSREIVEQRCTMEQAWQKIEEIDQIPLPVVPGVCFGSRLGILLLSFGWQRAGQLGFLYIGNVGMVLCTVSQRQKSQ